MADLGAAAADRGGRGPAAGARDRRVRSGSAHLAARPAAGRAGAERRRRDDVRDGGAERPGRAASHGCRRAAGERARLDRARRVRRGRAQRRPVPHEPAPRHRRRLRQRDGDRRERGRLRCRSTSPSRPPYWPSSRWTCAWSPASPTGSGAAPPRPPSRTSPSPPRCSSASRPPPPATSSPTPRTRPTWRTGTTCSGCGRRRTGILGLPFNASPSSPRRRMPSFR